MLQVLARSAGTKSGYVFVAEKKGGTTGGPMIVDSRGRVVWYHQIAPPLQATDFRVQRYRGKPVLTWWQGNESVAGTGKGEYEIYDTSYRHIATVRAGNGLHGDLHEFQLTPRGTAFITAYREVAADLSGVGGPKQGFVDDSVVEEIDIATGRVLFEWHSIGHVPFSESTQANREPARNASRKRPLDYFHVNSVADGPGGTILISGRNVSTVYLLARDGHIVWRLGGKRSDFGPKAAVRFAFQHNARLHGNLLSLFDNGGIPRVEPFSRPLVLRLDVPARRATIVRTFQPPKKIASPYEGNLQLLPGGGALVGWGGIRQVSEFGSRRPSAAAAEAPLRRHLPGLPRRVGGASRDAARRRGRRQDALRELERQDGDRPLAAARRRRRRAPRTGRRAGLDRARDRDRARRDRESRRRARARRARQRSRHLERDRGLS